eukprot:scaffold123980_cov69-Phaeocystis_antarctica.AAC.2
MLGHACRAGTWGTTLSCQTASRRGSVSSASTWPSPLSVRRAAIATAPPTRSPSLASHTRAVRAAICAGTIGEVLMTKSTCPKPDNSQWAEPGEF